MLGVSDGMLEGPYDGWLLGFEDGRIDGDPETEGL